MNIRMIVALAITAVLIGWAMWVVSSKPGAGTTTPTVVPTAVIENGVQVIDITAKGGYSPRVVQAKAGVQTVLRVITNNTFDCSSSIVIPKLSYQKFLQPSGVAEISIPADKAVGTLQGTCAMGMYNFQIRFE